MKKKMNHNRVINGTHGKVWCDGDKYGNVKSAEAKATLNYEEIQQAEELSPGQKYMGYTITGTIVGFKIDSYIPDKLEKAMNSGVMEESTLIMALEDPAAYGYERVEITGVTFDEVSIMKFEVGKTCEEEIPFKARKYRFLDKIA